MPRESTLTSTGTAWPITTMDNLRPLAGGAEFTVVTDSPALLEEIHGHGLPGILWTPDLVVPDGTSVVLALCHRMGTKAIRQQFRAARVLALPIRSFDDSPEAVAYTLSLVLATDYADSCRRNNEWVDLLRDKPDGLLHFVGPNADLRCRLGDNLRVDTSLELEIGRGEWVSVGNYCEVSLTPPSTSDWHGSFIMDGYVEAVGVLVAEDSRSSDVGKERIEAARRLRAEMVELGPVRLELADSRLRSAVLNGQERVADISDATNPDYDLHATELGLGTNPGIAPHVDWSFNSQLNEGVGMIHLGWGEGMTGAHMDFIVDNISLDA